MRDVLIVQLARMGDILQSKRLVLSLAAETNTRVHLCVDVSLTGFAKVVFPFAEVHSIPCHNSTSDFQDGIFSNMLKSLKAIGSINFERIYFLNSSPLSYAMGRLFPQEVLRGYANVNGQPLRSSWVRLASRLVKRRQVAPLNLVDMWAFFHGSPIAPEKVNPIPRAAGSGRVGIVMAGRNARRSLSSEALAEIVLAVFQARKGPKLVCLGSRDEQPLVRRLSRLLPAKIAGSIEDLTGKTSLEDLPEVLEGLDLLLTPDTGLMHLAAHLGVPVHAFFLSSAWCFETGPYGFGHKIWQAAVPCAPCLESAPCDNDLKCLAPFTHKGAVAHLTGKFEAEWPQELLGCVTGFDRLGAKVLVVDGVDRRAEERNGLRNAVMEYLGVGGYGIVPAAAAEFIYDEADWMLPGDAGKAIVDGI